MDNDERIHSDEYRESLDEKGMMYCDIHKAETSKEGAVYDTENGIDTCAACHAEWLKAVAECPHLNLEENELEPGDYVCTDCLSGGHKLKE